jgi:hypothetical protein
MKKNIFKKIIVSFSLGFVLIGFNFTNAVDDIPLVCTLPKVLNEIGDTCVAPIINPIECVAPKTLIDGVCTDPKIEPTLYSISITTPATKLNYIAGEILDISGLVVTGTYSDGVTKSEDITGKITGFDSSVPMTGQILTITIDGKITTYTVNILKNSSGGSTDPDPFFIEGNVILEDSCTIEDTNGVTHTFPKENSPSEFLGVCALVVAEQDGLIENFEFIDFGWGLFLESINGVATGDNWDPSWSIYYIHNEERESALVGLTDLVIENGDTISLIFTSFEDSKEYEKVVLHISYDENVNNTSVPSTQTSSSGGGGSSNNQKDFSLENALSFLSSQQKIDGSFGDVLYTDWVAVGISQIKKEDVPLKINISNYLKNNQINSSIITDYERRAMALMALGINPYNGTNVDYIKKITDSFDGTQIGDISLFNDDIFGLIVLQNTGYNLNYEIIQKVIPYIISKQSSDGSWGSVDMTSAGIMALKYFDQVDGVSDAISKAENYLIESQNTDGGFDNSSSTSWATQALSLNNSFNQNVDDAIEYLTDQQQDDGGLIGSDINNRIWVTSYVIPAILKVSWSEILNSFDRPTSSLEVQKEPVKTVKKENKKINITEKEKIRESLDKAELNNNLLVASAGNSNVNNFFKNKITIISIISVLIISIGGWLTRRYII